MVSAADETPAIADVRSVLEDVRDPEIPILTIADLGILRDVAIENGEIVIVITPTYSGCPAMNTIEQDIRAALDAAGIAPVRIETRLAPAWTTDWLSAAGRCKLLEVGIAPPAERSTNKRLLGAAPAIACPQCGSQATERVSEFGSTACKALYRCRECLEPFDYFKCI
jgi:ring-1,2-phenylacetyl-CoA epoxidase subunit PaaD|tara:strand:- start:3733 stop:4236 length:504 start_codon:yes stop_codon:yes gene_type:complete